MGDRMAPPVPSSLTLSQLVDTATPIDKALNFLQRMLKGAMPTFAETLEVYQLLSETRDLRNPIELEQQLWDEPTMDTTVTRAMLQMLQGRRVSSTPKDQYLPRAESIGGTVRLTSLSSRSSSTGASLAQQAMGSPMLRAHLLSMHSLNAAGPSEAQTASCSPAARRTSSLGSAKPLAAVMQQGSGMDLEDAASEAAVQEAARGSPLQRRTTSEHDLLPNGPGSSARHQNGMASGISSADCASSGAGAVAAAGESVPAGQAHPASASRYRSPWAAAAAARASQGPMGAAVGAAAPAQPLGATAGAQPGPAAQVGSTDAAPEPAAVAGEGTAQGTASPGGADKLMRYLTHKTRRPLAIECAAGEDQTDLPEPLASVPGRASPGGRRRPKRSVTTGFHTTQDMSPVELAAWLRAVEADAAEPNAESWIGPPQLTVTPELDRLLAEAESSWKFDAFRLAEATANQGLSVLTFHLIKTSGVLDELQLDEIRLLAFLRRIEAGYTAAPYHNKNHVATVVQAMHMLLRHSGMQAQGIAAAAGPMLACYIAAACHDFEHAGVSNDFLIATNDDIALTYNDQSPWESHHVSASFKLMQRPKFNFMQDLSAAMRKELRSAVIDMVLATDMKKHFNIMSRFQNAFRDRAEGPEGIPLVMPTLGSEEQSLVLQVALKCADVSHLAAEPALHRKWAGLLEEEMFCQGDQERAADLTISPLMDRHSPAGGITRTQAGFFEIVVLPAFERFVSTFPGAQPFLQAARVNYMGWKAPLPEAAAAST